LFAVPPAAPTLVPLAGPAPLAAAPLFKALASVALEPGAGKVRARTARMISATMTAAAAHQMRRSRHQPGRASGGCGG
jgi:GH24 family phage-related lysozyme (muramidase)